MAANYSHKHVVAVPPFACNVLLASDIDILCVGNHRGQVTGGGTFDQLSVQITIVKVCI
jgi:hypothetical protein